MRRSPDGALCIRKLSTVRSFRIARSGVIVGTLRLVTTAVFPATSSYAEPGRAVHSVTSCRGEALRGVFTQIPGSWGMGHVEFTLRLTNRSTGTCTVPARPGLELIGRSGERLPTHVGPWPPGADAPAVRLRPGTSAQAAALVTVDIPGPGDSHRRGGPCEPAAVELRVGAAAETSTLLPVQPPTSVCQRGSILLKPLAGLEPAPKVANGLLALVRGLIRYPPAEYTLTVRYDPRDRSWAEWSFAPAGPADQFQGGTGFANFVGGRWHSVGVASNPGFCPPAVPKSVIRAFGISCVNP